MEAQNALETRVREPDMGLLKEEDAAMLTDLYQLTMMACYRRDNKDTTSTFDLFARNLPKNRHYLVAAGLEQAIAYLQKAKFSKEGIEYLRQQNLFDESFLSYLEGWRFKGEVYAVKEGTPVFQNEPIMRITAPACEVQLIESYLLSMINYQTTVASKASRIVESAKGRPVVDFALRRCHGPGAALLEARAAYIAGCAGTSNVAAGKRFGIPIKGTMAHALVMQYDDESEPFRVFADTFKNTKLPLVLLIDTYDTIKGAENAIGIAKELEKEGKRLAGVRLDSGDLTSLSKQVRQIFDSAGLDYLTIFASNDLNEWKIEKMLLDGAPIGAFGVGTEMGVSLDAPALSGVYKLAECTSRDGNLVERMKMSEGKDTLPGRKQVYRIYDANGRMVKDVIALENEQVQGEALLVKVMENGELCGPLPSLQETRTYCLEQVARIPEATRKDDRYLHMKLSDIGYGMQDMDILGERNVPYKVEVSKGLNKLIEELKAKHRR
ncbi:MAG TPA: nicotinate phosphoribosyltransferase [Nanoarchaeota archaeon]|nr:nicotinate phosphoribosyltransferase [Nanoarchaeota archaeon]